MRRLLVVLLACAIAIGVSARARPSQAQPTIADLDRARIMYRAAELAMAESRFGDAARDFKLAYDFSKDPALLYKIAAADEKGGHCDLAIDYYRRYLREGHPTADFIVLAKDHIRACHGDPDQEPAGPAGSDSGSGSAGSGSAATSTDAGSGSDAGSAEAGSGSARTTSKPLVARHRAAWLLIGGAIAAATTGAVLAYSANASERDIDDLYIGLAGVTPTFDDKTRAKFDDLVAEGKRYQRLSWASFGLAGVLGALAAWRFATDEKPHLQVTPTASPTGAGVSATLRW